MSSNRIVARVNGSSETDEAGVVLAFLQRYLSDKTEGSIASVEHYQGLFPGFEAAIAREFAELTRAPAPTGEADRAARTPSEGSEPSRMLTIRDADALASSLQRGRSDADERYEIEEEIGRGGTGIVYRVREASLRRTLAMKVLRRKKAGVAESAPAWIRFLEEAQITSQLQHPAIVPVHEVGFDSAGRPFFTMPLIRGENFSALIARVDRQAHGTAPAARAIDVLLRVCEAVAFAHSRGVVHRDLKPSNVMVGSFGEVYVMDWGLAALAGEEERGAKTVERALPELSTTRADVVDRDPSSGLRTRDGDVVGTPAYMSPEQASGSSVAVGPPADIYGVGAMLYELLTGKRPHRSRASVVAGLPIEIEALAPSAPSELVAICEKAMARAVDDRYASMRELAHDLEAYRSLRVVRAYKVGAWAELRKWLARNRGLALASLAALVALVAGTALSLVLKARSDENAQRAQAALVAGEIERARLVEGSGDLPAAESTLWRHYLEDRSPQALWALRELYQRQKFLASRRSEHQINSVVYGPDDRFVACVNFGGELEVRDPRSLARRRVLDTPGSAELRGLDVRKDGLVAVGDRRGLVTTWQVETGELVRTLRVPGTSAPGQTALKQTGPGQADALCFDETGERLAVGYQGSIRVWSVDDARVLQELPLPPHGKIVPEREFVLAIRYCAARSTWIGSTSAGRILLWRDASEELSTLVDPELYARRARDPSSQWIVSLAVSRDGRFLWSGSSDRSVLLWDLEARLLLRSVRTQAGVTRFLCLSPDEGVLVVASDFRMSFRDARTLAVRREIPVAGCWSARFSRDARSLLLGIRHFRVALWEYENQATTRLPGHVGRSCVGISPDQGTLATGDGSGRVRLWSLSQRKFVRELSRERAHDGAQSAHERRVVGISFAPDGRHMLTIARSEPLRVWDLRTFACVREFRAHPGMAAGSARFTADSRQLILVERSGVPAIYDVASGARVRALPAVPAQTMAIALRPGADEVLMTARRHKFALCAMPAGPRVAIGRESRWAPWSIAVSSDGRLAASGLWNGSILTFDLERRAQFGEALGGHLGLVSTLAFQPDSARYLAACSVNGLRVWDLESRRCIMVLEDLGADMTSFVWGAHGRSLIASGDSPDVVIWDLEHMDRRVAGNLHRHLHALRDALDPAIVREHEQWAEARIYGR